MNPKQAVESEVRNEIDQVKLPDVSPTRDSDELTQAEQDTISGAGSYGSDDGSEGV
jgi:hypothetical protein